MNETFQQTFAGIFKEAFDLLVTRQRKYGPENIRQLGLFGVFGRMADDKIERIRRGMNGRIEHGKVVIEDFSDFGDESFEDALLDIANYALIMLALKRGVWGRPLDQGDQELILAGLATFETLTDLAPDVPEPAWVKDLMSNFSIASEEEMDLIAGTD